MKRMISIFCFTFFLIFGICAYTQEPSEKPRPQEEQKPEPMPEQTKPQKPEEAPQPEERKASKPENSKHEEQAPKEEAKPAHEEHGQNASHAQRAAGKGGHIPDDKFRASFGRQHTFVISRPVMVDNRPRFQVAGFWFEIIDPWPVAWAFTDDCFIEFIDGEYFLFDVLHPDMRVAVIVVV
jgi:hypothetical protein